MTGGRGERRIEVEARGGEETEEDRGEQAAIQTGN